MFDYDNQINANNKWDAKKTYKKTTGYFPGVATIGNKIISIENRDGNANVKFKQADTLKRTYALLEQENIIINRSRMDAGSYSNGSSSPKNALPPLIIGESSILERKP